jgi:hypothetical protein
LTLPIVSPAISRGCRRRHLREQAGKFGATGRLPAGGRQARSRDRREPKLAGEHKHAARCIARDRNKRVPAVGLTLPITLLGRADAVIE